MAAMTKMSHFLPLVFRSSKTLAEFWLACLIWTYTATLRGRMCMERRELLAGLATISALSAAPSLYAQATHQHSPDAGKNAAVIKTASDCETTGEICVSHCIELLSQGDKSLGLCAKRASELIAVCRALGAIATQDAPSLTTLAALAEDVCKRCETECRKFTQHPQCIACADACAACSAECKRLHG